MSGIAIITGSVSARSKTSALAARIAAPTERAKALLFEDPRSQELLRRARQVAAGDAPAVITGEIGTGKEIIARHVHELSARRGRPFLAVSCAALSPALAESELFGHEQGASPKALTRKPDLPALMDAAASLRPAKRARASRQTNEGAI
ncbi:sigma 54-interacting transcriptional regulator [Sorangium sp. So ce128]|uniref:sigma 54-interacting transcriptional regulator n=1 Tax=Sorangium sp. So ce128 TaxID=3133281 RepID=UPI003F5DBCF8